MTVLDSSVWIAWLNQDDGQHAKAKKIFKQIKLPILLPEYVILEVCTVLTLRVDKQTSDRFLELISNNRDAKILLTDEVFFQTLMQEYRAQRRRLSFTDVALTLLAKSFPVVTFDEQLGKTIKKMA
jgi:predicted nucleic acid-binding protein